MPVRPFAQHRKRHRRASLLIVGSMAMLLALSGWALGGPDGVLAAFLAGALGLAVDRVRPDWVLRAFGGRPVDPRLLPDLHGLLAALSRRAGLSSIPRLYVVPRRSLQALAVGQGGEAAVAVSTGLLAALTPRELAAVLAHEISHIRAGDTGLLRLGAIAANTVRMMAFLGLAIALLLMPWAAEGQGYLSGLGLALLALAPAATDLLLLRLSREREFAADAGAVELTGDPLALASALAVLARLQGDGWESVGRSGAPWWARLFRSHPLTAERIERLKGLLPGRRVAPWGTWVPC